MKYQRCIVPLSHHVSGEESGDCWRACIASLLELPAEEVPNFVHLAQYDFLDRTREWLAERNYAIFARDFGAKDWPFEKLADWLAEAGPNVGYIVTGIGGGEEHAVVVLNGVLHDPSDCGIQGPQADQGQDRQRSKRSADSRGGHRGRLRKATASQ